MNDPTDNYSKYLSPICHLEIFQSVSKMSYVCSYCGKHLNDEFKAIGEHFITKGNIFFCRKSPASTNNKKNNKQKPSYHPYYHN